MKTIYSLKSKMTDLESISQMIIRFSIAIVMWPHGAQLMLGIFGGSGYSSTMDYFTNVMQLPYLIGIMVIFLQFFGSIFILVGLFTRITSLLMAIVTIGMIFSGHIEHGFFMNWFNIQKGEGFEFHLLLLGLCLALLFARQYRFSLDYSLFGNNPKNELHEN